VSRGLRNGLIVAVLHVLMVAAIGGKLLVDRATRPRVWARTGPIDPDLPIRGRYVSLQIEVNAKNDFVLTAQERQDYQAQSQTSNFNPRWWWGSHRAARLYAENGKLYATPDETSTAMVRIDPSDGTHVFVDSPVLYFIAEHAQDPSWLTWQTKNELWVEVTVPAKGPPRPIRLGVKKPNSSTIDPLPI